MLYPFLRAGPEDFIHDGDNKCCEKKILTGLFNAFLTTESWPVVGRGVRSSPPISVQHQFTFFPLIAVLSKTKSRMISSEGGEY